MTENKGIQLKMKQIFKSYASPLYLKVKEINLMGLSPQCRDIVLTGLNYYLELTIRLNKLAFARETCEKIIREIPENYRKPYSSRLTTIDRFEKKSFDKYDYDTKTEFGMKLKEALVTKK